jgi:hypothetical protein
LTSFPSPDRETRLYDRVINTALAEVGTREIGKNNHGPGPKKYLAICGLPEGYAYCACFVKWSLFQHGVITKGTAWSPSWSVGPEVYYRQGKFINGNTPRQSDVFTLFYSSLNRVGHVGFIHVWNDPRADDWVFTVEGNTNGEGSREGDGVHKRRRLKRSIYTLSRYTP